MSNLDHDFLPIDEEGVPLPFSAAYEDDIDQAPHDLPDEPFILESFREDLLALLSDGDPRKLIPVITTPGIHRKIHIINGCIAVIGEADQGDGYDHLREFLRISKQLCF